MSSSSVTLRLATEPVVCATLEEIARAGARRALQQAIEDEVADYINTHRDQLDQPAIGWWSATATNPSERSCLAWDRSR